MPPQSQYDLMIVQAAFHLLRSGCQIHRPASYQICLMVSGWDGEAEELMMMITEVMVVVRWCKH